ncbi:MAG: ExbD/TolR family protein [Planctomycetota bacterium]|jgi:biopolymer transport protein ExbD
MAKSSVYGKGKAEVSFNMTPMIDCTFLLIIFFMLTTQIASKDFVRMRLPEPKDSVAKEMKTDRAIINVVPYSDDEEKADDGKNRGKAKRYQIGQENVALNDMATLMKLLKKARGRIEPPAKRKEFAVEIRADEGICYSQIQPILSALQQAEMENMHITAMVRLREGGS